MSVSSLRDLASRGQSVWLDDLHRGLIESGELERLIREDGLAGLTSNPAILAQALRGRSEYRDEVRGAHRRGEPAPTIFEALAIADVQAAADVFRPVFEATAARDGYVSMEVSPRLAGAGARMQRLLWASTSTKDPSYRDVRYVEDLVAEHTINTMPPVTLAAFRDHGTAGDAFDRHRAGAEVTLSSLVALGVDVEEIAVQLEREGVRKFIEPFESLERWMAEGG